MSRSIEELIDELLAKADEADHDTIYRLKNMLIPSVHLVDRGANKRTFVVMKRGEDMDSDFLGPEVVEAEDGSLQTVEPVEKALALPGPAKTGMLKIVTEAQERGASLMNRIKDSSESDGAKVPMELVNEAMAISKLYASLGERYPSPKMAADPAMEDEKKKKKKGEEEDDDMKKLDDGSFQIGEDVFDGFAGEVAGLLVQKAGRKIAGRHLKKLKELMTGLTGLLKELDPSDISLKDAFASLHKRLESDAEKHSKEVAALRAQLSELAAIAQKPISAGSSASPGESVPVAKRKQDERVILYNTDLYPNG